jgi:hypothetical protein
MYQGQRQSVVWCDSGRMTLELYRKRTARQFPSAWTSGVHFRAQALLKTLGYTENPADTMHDFLVDPDFLRWVRDHDNSPHRWENREIGPIGFWYRSSPRPLYSLESVNWGEESPPLQTSGMTLVRLSPKGRLLKLVVVPPQTGERDAAAQSASSRIGVRFSRKRTWT